jgi:methyltransferase (TIGR00027 family)
VGPQEREIIADNSVARGLDKDYREAMKGPETRVRVLMVNIRTRYIDQSMHDAVGQGARQVVIHRAGFDSRVYRFRQLPEIHRVFEVDFGPAQEYKRRRAAEILGPPPPNLSYVAVDSRSRRLATSCAAPDIARTGKRSSSGKGFRCT